MILIQKKIYFTAYRLGFSGDHFKAVGGTGEIFCADYKYSATNARYWPKAEMSATHPKRKFECL